eukprot:CAMPEP_0173381278 /NCGR_PEP_ID=MMETSP1356-20130122/3681_1 /TAXON_ID=77927 ORGANISM="Hemiselmis virescens, Strain PCC157" /NCGR_SAMPLE_ID=MMETSP1356 /ASSEMBLY_ACC=CAM_ASM_000847 /LENGTH=279 /DNA_ID=CAMNT_0014335043 /DNA_START=9 /DNA_END=851 /DNA_ORIENTATION=-
MSVNVLQKLPRAARLFNSKDKRLLNVAIDHGVFNEDRFLDGIEDMPSVLETLIKAQPDVIQLTMGQAKHMLAAGAASGTRLPALVLRTDVANVYGTKSPAVPFCNLQHASVVEEALRLDACGVICNLLLLPADAQGAGELHQQCIKNVCHLRSECTKYGMPFIVEPLAFKWGANMDSFSMDTSVAVTRPLVRLACELGADIIKLDPPSDVSEFPKLLKVCQPCPVLLRGGDKGEESAVMAAAKALLDAGASGLVYGRNIIHHDDPSGITKRFMQVVHGA